MSKSAIEVLTEEIAILQRLSQNVQRQRSDYIKHFVDKISDVEKEIKILLGKAGVLNEHEGLLKKKRELKKQSQQVQEEIDLKVQQAMDIATYLQSRIAALEAQFKKDNEQ